MKEIYFIIDGKVQPKERPIVCRNPYTGKVHGRTPVKTKEYEERVRASYIEACEGKKVFFTGAIEIVVNVYLKIPQGASKQTKEMMLLGHIRPIVKNGDVDNYLKAIADALNEVAYTDDSRIVTATVRKFYGSIARAEVTIREVKNESEV